MDNIMEISKSDNSSNESEIPAEIAKEKTVGKFKPSKKLLKFVTIKGNFKYHTHEANISVEKFFDDRYKDVFATLTICDDGNVNIDEVGTNYLDDNQKQRFLEMLLEKDVIPLRTGDFALGMVFKPTENAQEKDVQLYLAVEHTTPYNKLLELLDDEVTISDEQASKLDALFGDLDLVEEISPETEDLDKSKSETMAKVVTIQPLQTDYLKKLNDSFEKAKQDKEEELMKRLQDKQRDLAKYITDKRFAESKINEVSSEIELLESRLSNIKPNAADNGWVFFIAEGEKGIDELDPSFVEIIQRKFKKSAEAILAVIKGSSFSIKIAKKGDLEAEVTQEIMDALSKIDNPDFLSLGEKPGEFRYTGELKWHGLVEKMTKLGFQQDPEFDKLCGSNSYQSEVAAEQDIDTNDNGFDVEVED